MSGALDHPINRIIAELLIDLSVGTSITSGEWAVFAGSLPDQPDSCIRVSETTSVSDGRLHPTGLTVTHPGVQILIRDPEQEDGHEKANAIAVALDTVERDVVTIGASTYLIQAVNRVGDPIYLGTDVPRSQFHLYSLNATVTLRKTS